MAFLMTTVMERGTGEPEIARFLLQTAKLLEHTTLTKLQKEDAFKVTFGALKYLLQCKDIHSRISRDMQAIESEEKLKELEKNKEIPAVMNLERDCEIFLYAAKNFFRDIAMILNCSFGTSFENAIELAVRKNGKDGNVVAWARDKFGEQHPFFKFLESNQQIVLEICQMRNAVEHPGGASGTLEVKNYTYENGRLSRPVWCRYVKTFSDGKIWGVRLQTQS